MIQLDNKFVTSNAEDHQGTNRYIRYLVKIRRSLLRTVFLLCNVNIILLFPEISYLQLTFLDLSGNRISVLPNELRFMTTVVELNLGENPLTCPPANVRIVANVFT